MNVSAHRTAFNHRARIATFSIFHSQFSNFLDSITFLCAALNGLRRKLCQVQGLTEGVFAQHSRARQIVVQLDDPSLVLRRSSSRRVRLDAVAVSISNTATTLCKGTM